MGTSVSHGWDPARVLPRPVGLSHHVPYEDGPTFMDVSWVDRPLDGFSKIRRKCEECGTFHVAGDHPDDECKLGTVDRVMNS